MIRALLMLLTLTTSAAAHDWYPNSCCHGRDCYSVDITADEIEIIPNVGYHIIPSNELILFSDVRIEEFPAEAYLYEGAIDHFHRCASFAGTNPSDNPDQVKALAKRSGRTVCLFVPRGAF